jgi:hypothetical protein
VLQFQDCAFFLDILLHIARGTEGMIARQQERSLLNIRHGVMARHGVTASTDELKDLLRWEANSGNTAKDHLMGVWILRRGRPGIMPITIPHHKWLRILPDALRVYANSMFFIAGSKRQ